MKYNLFNYLNFIKSTNRDNWINYISKDILNIRDKIEKREKIIKISENYFNAYEVEEINKILSKFGKVYIFHNKAYFENLNTLIKFGYIRYNKNIKNNLNKLNYKNICVIDFDNDINNFGNIIYKSTKNIYLKCRLKNNLKQRIKK